MTIVLVALIASLLFLASGLLKMQTKSYQLTHLTWPEIRKTLKPVNDDGIDRVAFDHLRITEQKRVRTHDEILDLVGGADGLEAMRLNSEAFVVLAAKSLAQKGTSSETAYITEQMQSDAEDLRRAVLNFSLSTAIGYRKRRMTLYLRQAASAYYLIRTRFFSLYDTDDWPHADCH